MKSPSKIFIIVLLLLAFLAGLAWVGVRQLSDILKEFDHVTQVDLVLMEVATSLNNIQLEKEVVFAKLTSSADELAFSQVNAARSQYLADFVKGLSGQFESYSQIADEQIQAVDTLRGAPVPLKISFEKIRDQIHAYDSTVKDIFKAVEKGGFQLSLEDLDNTDRHQKILMVNLQSVVSQVWGLVHESVQRSQRWHEQSKTIFLFSLLLTVTLGLLLFAFKKNLEAITRQRQDLEKLNQELDRFVHTVSHDIAGPLTTIVGYAALLEGQYAKQLDIRGQDCIKGVRKGATRLSALIKDMLELTRMTRVKSPYSKVLVQEIVDAAITNCEFMTKQSSADIKIVGNLPEIVGDRIKLNAVFTNLISNAIKFTKPNELPAIKIGWNETRDSHEFYVQDNGIGIDTQNQQEIFEIFKRLDKSGQYDGSGVGLAIVKAAVEDHGGRVRVESAPHQGTKFIFNIPKNLVPAKPLY